MQENRMRRTDREIGERETIDGIIRRCRVCHLGVLADGEPYVVPLLFAYDGNAVYLHMASSGRKLEALERGGRVCLEWEVPGAITQSPVACAWGIAYESVIAWGTPAVVSDEGERRKAMDLLMDAYSDAVPEQDKAAAWEYVSDILERTVVIRVPLEMVTAKARL